MFSLLPSFILLFFLNFQILKNTSLRALKSTLNMKNGAQGTTFRILSLLLKTQNMRWKLKAGHFTTVQWLPCSYSEGLALCPIFPEKYSVYAFFYNTYGLIYEHRLGSRSWWPAQLRSSDCDRLLLVSWVRCNHLVLVYPSIQWDL